MTQRTPLATPCILFFTTRWMSILLAVVGINVVAAGRGLSQSKSSSQPVLKIGSKAFTESVVLGELLSHLGRDAGARVDHLSELGGTQILWNALQSGEIDAYIDYTGTIQEEILADAARRGAHVETESEMREELAKRNILMSERIGFNNTYALGMREDVAARLAIRKISDLKNHPELEYGLSDEFMERRDGWNQLASRYGIKTRRIRTMDHNLGYRGLVHDAIQVTDVYTTDAEIQYYKLRVLEDDLQFFPTYYAVLLMRADLQTRAPEVANALLKIQGLIDPVKMSGMTAMVRLDGKNETYVAGDFLNTKLLMQLELPSNTLWAEWRRIADRLLKTTLEHLFLVAVSLTLAILVAIPLGIISARNERVANVLLGVVSVIQTLPSMALLVFMIPLFGLGAVPAIAALFFYSLLPIVRNTYAGLRQIPMATRESAEVLGLDSKSQLRMVELPLALPSILSGIKTAAVINVGTATIGALIGAGGYGAPILTGIRLSSIPLILQGAIPAAAMAVLAQWAFGKLEKKLVSPGLQPQS
jgi:osmoprotectant transport system permease protein